MAFGPFWPAWLFKTAGKRMRRSSETEIDELRQYRSEVNGHNVILVTAPISTFASAFDACLNNDI